MEKYNPEDYAELHMRNNEQGPSMMGHVYCQVCGQDEGPVPSLCGPNSTGYKSSTASKVRVIIAKEEDDALPIVTTVDQYLIRAVQEALRLGRQGTCPQCGFKSDNVDDSLLSMRCPVKSCLYQWCFCCGRGDTRGKRGATQRESYRESFFCTSCDDSTNVNMMYHRKGTFACCIVDRHQFARCKTLYFLKQIKDNVPSALWKSFQQRHFCLWRELPAAGLNVLWVDIDQATLPLRGETRKEQVVWKSDMKPILEKLRMQIGLMTPSVVLFDNDDNDDDKSEESPRDRPKKKQKLEHYNEGLWVAAVVPAVAMLLTAAIWRNSHEEP